MNFDGTANMPGKSNTAVKNQAHARASCHDTYNVNSKVFDPE